MSDSLFDLIASAAEATAGQTALVTPEGAPISYGALKNTIGAYAERAREAGVRKGQSVTLHAVSMTQFLMMLVALSRLGVVLVRSPDDDGEEGGVGADFVLVDRRSGLAGRAVAWPAIRRRE